MSAEPSLPLITCPSSLVASCAPLLGFVPNDCLVALIHGVPGRLSPVILRVDLPPAGRAAPAAIQTASSIAGTGGLAIDAVAWVPSDDSAARPELPSADFLAELETALAVLGIEVGAALSTNGRVWWSHCCEDSRCCPDWATPLDLVTVNAVQAEYVYAGYAPLASRQELSNRIARDEARAARVQTTFLQHGPAKPTQRWRDAQVRILTETLLPAHPCPSRSAPLSPFAAARMHRALADIRVRDVVLHRLVVRGAHCDRCARGTMDTLCDALRCAPSGSGAPVATILALVAWMRGEGALATVCVQRALGEDPDYRLAALAAQLMSRGTDPRTWRASLVGLAESECRNPRGR
jgi:hypothetical protein